MREFFLNLKHAHFLKITLIKSCILIFLYLNIE